MEYISNNEIFGETLMGQNNNKKTHTIMDKYCTMYSRVSTNAYYLFIII